MWDVEKAEQVLRDYGCKRFIVDSGGRLFGQSDYSEIEIPPSVLMVIMAQPEKDGAQ